MGISKGKENMISFTSTSDPLQDVCVQRALQHLDRLGNIKLLGNSFLSRVLPHCNEQQLMKVEEENPGRDLSPITNKLWMNFYQKKFGHHYVSMATERMKETGKEMKQPLKWKDLYKEKLNEGKSQDQEADKNTKLIKKAAQNTPVIALEQNVARKENQQHKAINILSTSKIAGRRPSNTVKRTSESNNKRGSLMKKTRREFKAYLQHRDLVIRKK